jgi:hypothetical protein
LPLQYHPLIVQQYCSISPAPTSLYLLNRKLLYAIFEALRKAAEKMEDLPPKLFQ